MKISIVFDAFLQFFFGELIILITANYYVYTK